VYVLHTLGAIGIDTDYTTGSGIGIDTDTTIRPGQRVRVVGDGKDWGRGQITIQNLAQLELIGVSIFVHITIEPGVSTLSFLHCNVLFPGSNGLVVPTGGNSTVTVVNTTIGVSRTAETFAAFAAGIVVDGALTLFASGLAWGSNIYVGVAVAHDGSLDCISCDMRMTPLGMYLLYKEGAPKFVPATEHGVTRWRDVVLVNATLEATPTTAHEGWISRPEEVVFDPSGRMLASGSSDGTVQLWDVATGQCIATLEGSTSLGVSSLAFDSTGGTLASACADGTVKLWDVATRQCIATLDVTHSIGVLAFDVSGETHWPSHLRMAR
jgi:WD40 repeat protein